MADDKLIEIDLETTLAKLWRAMRELRFHVSAATGAEEGLVECLGEIDAKDGLDEVTDAPEISLWARRVSASNQAVAEMAHVVAVEANILAAIFQPVDPTKGH